MDFNKPDSRIVFVDAVFAESEIESLIKGHWYTTQVDLKHFSDLLAMRAASLMTVSNKEIAFRDSELTTEGEELSKRIYKVLRREWKIPWYYFKNKTLEDKDIAYLIVAITENYLEVFQNE